MIVKVVGLRGSMDGENYVVQLVRAQASDPATGESGIGEGGTEEEARAAAIAKLAEVKEELRQQQIAAAKARGGA